jgi:hypothetical protein
VKKGWTPWLTPVILATQEVEIRKMAVQGQPPQIVHKTHHKKGLAEWLGKVLASIRPSVQTQCHQKKKKKSNVVFCWFMTS